MAEASNYIKGILDRAVADLRAKDEASTEQFKADIDSHVAELKQILDNTVKEFWDAVEQHINDAHADVQEAIADDSEQAAPTPVSLSYVPHEP